VGSETVWHDAVASLGVRPNFPLTEPLLEVHALDFNRDLYGQYVRVALVEFLREEKKFADLEALKAQIKDDCEAARKRLSSVPLHTEMAGNAD
jgi:riboflavin kinase / FMN adenylyltransferase